MAARLTRVVLALVLLERRRRQLVRCGGVGVHVRPAGRIADRAIRDRSASVGRRDPDSDSTNADGRRGAARRDAAGRDIRVDVRPERSCQRHLVGPHTGRARRLGVHQPAEARKRSRVAPYGIQMYVVSGFSRTGYTLRTGRSWVGVAAARSRSSGAGRVLRGRPRPLDARTLTSHFILARGPQASRTVRRHPSAACARLRAATMPTQLQLPRPLHHSDELL